MVIQTCKYANVSECMYTEMCIIRIHNALSCECENKMGRSTLSYNIPPCKRRSKCLIVRITTGSAGDILFRFVRAKTIGIILFIKNNSALKQTHRNVKQYLYFTRN